MCDLIWHTWTFRFDDLIDLFRKQFLMIACDVNIFMTIKCIAENLTDAFITLNSIEISYCPSFVYDILPTLEQSKIYSSLEKHVSLLMLYKRFCPKEM